MKKIAIVGSGISGLSAAWALRDTADITLFESQAQLGGHAHTVDFLHTGAEMTVDVGFIVCNPLNYPNFMNFMQALGVETQASDMSFAVSDPNGYEWSSDPKGLFAQRRNFLNPRYISMLLEILSFNKNARHDVEQDQIPIGMTLGAYLDKIGCSKNFRKNYILPMGAAIWSTPEANMEDYPAASFLNFFNNHKLIHLDRPQWRTVRNGSRSYVKQIGLALGNRVQLSNTVTRVDRTATGVRVTHSEGEDLFDQVILACHAPQSHDMLGDGFEHQASILAPVKTTKNRAVLHSDIALMPRRTRAWASWNVMKGTGKKISLTYWMNRLQGLDPDRNVFVSLNPITEPNTEHFFAEFEFSHPLFNMEADQSVRKIKSINGRDGLWFAGAWMGHGFHEDGLKSGLSAALAIGGVIPWSPVGLEDYPKAMLKSNIPQTNLVVAAQ